MQITPDNKCPTARVLVVGDAMLDRYWYGAVDRISARKRLFPWCA